MIQDRPFFGILLMLGFCVLAPMGDSIAKLLGPTVPLLLLLVVRFTVQSIVLFPICLASRIPLRAPKGKAWLIWARTVLHIVGIGAMFTSLRYLPLADALAIAFVMPFIMLLLGHFVLQETVGVHRFAACAVGFIGTLLVIQPNFAEVGAPALLPLLVAVVFSLFMLITRQIAKDIDPMALQTIGGIQASLFLLPALILFPPDVGFMDLDSQSLWLLSLMGIVGTVAHLLMTWSLRFAPSATLAPMQYLEIPIGTVFGFVIFNELPNGLAAIGICITIAAGLYIIVRERKLSTHPTTT